jgi:hypothetical protein
VGACLEVLNGYRPAAHLRGLSRPFEAQTIIAHATLATDLIAARRRAELARSEQPSPRPQRLAPVTVTHLYTCEPRPGAVEAAAVLYTPERTWALALRLELHKNAWRANVFQLL